MEGNNDKKKKENSSLSSPIESFKRNYDLLMAWIIQIVMLAKKLKNSFGKTPIDLPFEFPNSMDDTSQKLICSM